MAYENLVEEVLTVVRRLQQEKGELSLAMLVTDSWGEDASWTLLVSAQWMDNMSRKEVIGHIISLLRKHLSRKNWSSILMVSVLRSDDSFVRSMNRSFSVTNSTATIQNLEIDGIELTRGVIFECHPPKGVAAFSR